MDTNQIVVRDSIIFAVALIFIAAGLADAVRLITGLSWWITAPIGAGVWIVAATLLYRRARRRLARSAPTEQEA